MEPNDQIVEDFKQHYQSIADYSKATGTSRQSVHRSIKRGTLNGVMIGKTWYVNSAGRASTSTGGKP